MFTLAADISLRILAAAAAVGLVLVVLRVRSGAARHAAWSAVLLAMLTMPLLMAIVPRVDVPVPSTLALDFGAIAGEPAPYEAVVTPIDSELAEFEGSLATTSPALEAQRTLPRLPFDWRTAAITLYGAGLVFFFVRLAGGWIVARRLVAGAARTDVKNRAPVYESAAIATPLTTGVFSPSVLLPLAWRGWPVDKLAAVLAHENAHIARRDALVAFLAHANRAIFWFHPLAWWLERTLAVTAEHACDETAAREVGQPRRYAEVLLDMAEAVQRRGHRVSWQTIGVDGSGLLGTRIDRLLKGDVMARMSGVQRTAVAVGCAAVLALAVACRQQIAPLQPDPEVARQLEAQAVRTKEFYATRDMTPAQADVLEARIAKDPNDWDARKQLVTYYTAGRAVPWEKKVPGLRRHALWLIEHHPEHEIPPPSLSPQYDPEGFAQAVRLWEGHLSRPDASPFLVYRAARFFTPHDKPRAEQLILRGLAMDPESAALKAKMPPNVGGYQWDYQLGSLYGAALMGSRNPLTRTYDEEQSRSPFAMEVRKKLDESQDAALLGRVGSHLLSAASREPAVAAMNDLGRRYAERALMLKPDLESARRSLQRAEQRERHFRLQQAMREGALVSDADRVAFLAAKAQLAYSADATWHFRRDDGKAVATAEERLAEAKSTAAEALKLAATDPANPEYSETVTSVHQTLGLVALREGKRAEAVRHLQASAEVPAIPESADIGNVTWLRLTNYLLKDGERESVIAFLEAYAKVRPAQRDRLLEDAAAIRAGRMPRSFQTMFARP
ncbi:MAG: M56 family metallopeptidase [Vicinamibacterales bacterium]